jgi:uncharacterized protein (TIGR00297 family)
MDALFATRILPAAALGVLAAVVSRRMRFLTTGGSVAAGFLAALLFGFGSWQWLLPMILFFVSSSLLSRICEDLVPGASDLFEKGSERDAVQVLANGGAGALLVVAAVRGESGALYAAYLGSLAAAAADTWGTELGMLSRSRPRLITTFAPVPPGTSGAVSAAGLFGALAGAALMAACGLAWTGQASSLIPPAVAAGGMAGAMLDSLLGATLQAHYRCGVCGARTERRTHCAAEARLDRGYRWLTNDGVNVVCNAAGALLGFFLAAAAM